MSSQQSRQVNDRLRVREESDAYFVVLEQDESDWIVKFSKPRIWPSRTTIGLTIPGWMR